jgi:hypothetical protein
VIVLEIVARASLWRGQLKIGRSFFVLYTGLFVNGGVSMNALK